MAALTRADVLLDLLSQQHEEILVLRQKLRDALAEVNELQQRIRQSTPTGPQDG